MSRVPLSFLVHTAAPIQTSGSDGAQPGVPLLFSWLRPSLRKPQFRSGSELPASYHSTCSAQLSLSDTISTLGPSEPLSIVLRMKSGFLSVAIQASASWHHPTPLHTPVTLAAFPGVRLLTHTAMPSCLLLCPLKVLYSCFKSHQDL